MNYPQVEKEALSLIYGFKKYHTYMYGHKFILETDHKSLTAIYGLKKGIPLIGVARLQRWAIQLSPYQYECKSMLMLMVFHSCHWMKDILEGPCAEPEIFYVSAGLSACYLHRIENLYVNKQDVE